MSSRIRQIVLDKLKELDWTAYRLWAEMGGPQSPVSKQTVVNFVLHDADVKLSTLIAILAALNLELIERKASKK